MRTQITAKGFRFSPTDREKINGYISKLSRHLLKFKEALPILTFVLKKDKTTSSAPKEKSAYYYEGTIKLLLPKKPLIAHIRESYTIEAIESGFKRIIKELQTYKGKHFKSHSDYKNHDSIKTKILA